MSTMLSPDWFQKTSVGQAMVEQSRKAAYTDRQLHVDRREALRQERAALADKHDRIIEQLLASAHMAQMKYERANAALVAAQRAKANALHANNSERDMIERTLRASASPQIDEARRRMDARFEHERFTMFRVVNVPTGKTDDRLRPIMKEVNNSAAIQRLHVAMRAARSAFEALKVQNPVDLGAAIADIENSIPWAAVEVIDGAGGEPQRAA